MIPRRRAIAVLAATVTSVTLASAVSAQGGAGSDRDVPPSVARALERLNRYRAAAGVPPAELHPALMRSASGHVGYYDRNKDAVGDLHQQIAGRPGFTGVTMADRANAAGYSSVAVIENVGSGGLVAAVDWAMGTASHRLPLIHPSALDVGMAESPSTGFNVISVGLRRGMSYAVLPSFYPSDGAREVPLSWDGSESPDPAPGISRPVGYPITVCFGQGQRVEWQSLELRGPDGSRVDTSVAQKTWMSAAALVPNKPLSPAARYTVKVIARVDGSALTREASFQTARS